ncbi:myosin phosphatase Rho-interacting protein isoform X3 [Globicephala melas]|uniref:myosin phosphatase Rho-interacting protein isoform X3 n=1 Tax=Globicephala melas TaxID=9731 RepID=UPI00293D947F|nr:myosin phosphatase Rho-interacting protein isoform X3 [Globicephala melas]XP_060146185.1 myosin phosphatase Rho-interacting protein isoform X3 [Globicephala melas]XP_060146186.1 myosin phosphatase Rho-interacting protein isoform X3 [Globicephala melas]
MSAAKENPCRKFQANIFNKSKCQNCFKPRESHLLNDEDLTQAKPIYGGWLLLAPDGTDFDNPVHRSRKWQRRFFILYEHGLLRYALDEMPTTLPQGTINMNQCTDVVDGEGRTGQKFSLCILTPEKEHFIRAETKEIISGWLEMLTVYPRTNKQNQKKKRKVEPPTPQEPGPAKMAVTSSSSSSSIPSAEKVPTTKSTLWQEEMRAKDQPDGSSPSPAQSPSQSQPPVASTLREPGLESRDEESTSSSERVDCGRKVRVESGYFSLEKTKQDAKAEEQPLPPPLSPPSPGTPTNRRSQVIEKFEALDIEKAEHMETNVSAGPSLSSDTRQGRSEKRAFPRKRDLPSEAPLPDASASPLSPHRRAKSLDRRSTEPSLTPDLLNFKKGWLTRQYEDGQWKKHWFVLADQSLRFYRDSVAEEAADLDGEIDLSTCYDVTEYPVQRNYGFQIHTKEGAFTLSAMTSGIRRNWIQTIMKHVHPISAPDVTSSLPQGKDRSSSPSETRLREKQDGEPGEPDPEQKRSRARERRREGRSKTFDWAEFRPIQQALAQQRASAPGPATTRPEAEPGELERERARRREERRKRFGAVDVADGPSIDDTALRMEVDRGPGPPATADLRTQNVHVEIEQRWHQVETTPLREEKQVPIAPLHLSSEDGSDRLSTPELTSVLEKELEQSQKEASDLLEQNRLLQDQLRVALGREQSAREGYVLQTEVATSPSGAWQRLHRVNQDLHGELEAQCQRQELITRQIQALKRSYGEAKDAIRHHEAEIRSLQARLGNAAAELTIKEQALAKLQGELKLEKDKVREQLEERQHSEAALNAQLRASERKLQSAEALLLGRTQELRDLERQQALQRDRQKEVQRLQERIADLSQQLSASERAQRLMEEKLQRNYELLLGSCEREKQELLQSLKEAEDRASAFEDRLQDHEQQMEVLQKEKLSAKSEGSEVVHRLEEQLEMKEASIQKLAEHVQSLRDERDLIRQRFQELMGRVALSDGDVAALEEKLKGREADYQSLERSYRRVASQLQGAHTRLREKEEELRCIQDTHEKALARKERDLQDVLVKMTVLGSSLEETEVKLQAKESSEDAEEPRSFLEEAEEEDGVARSGPQLQAASAPPGAALGEEHRDSSPRREKSPVPPRSEVSNREGHLQSTSKPDQGAPGLKRQRIRFSTIQCQKYTHPDGSERTWTSSTSSDTSQDRSPSEESMSSEATPSSLPATSDSDTYLSVIHSLETKLYVTEEKLKDVTVKLESQQGQSQEALLALHQQWAGTEARLREQLRASLLQVAALASQLEQERQARAEVVENHVEELGDFRVKNSQALACLESCREQLRSLPADAGAGLLAGVESLLVGAIQALCHQPPPTGEAGFSEEEKATSRQPPYLPELSDQEQLQLLSDQIALEATLIDQIADSLKNTTSDISHVLLEISQSGKWPLESESNVACPGAPVDAWAKKVLVDGEFWSQVESLSRHLETLGGEAASASGGGRPNAPPAPVAALADATWVRAELSLAVHSVRGSLQRRLQSIQETLQGTQAALQQHKRMLGEILGAYQTPDFERVMLQVSETLQLPAGAGDGVQVSWTGSLPEEVPSHPDPAGSQALCPLSSQSSGALVAIQEELALQLKDKASLLGEISATLTSLLSVEAVRDCQKLLQASRHLSRSACLGGLGQYSSLLVQDAIIQAQVCYTACRIRLEYEKELRGYRESWSGGGASCQEHEHAVGALREEYEGLLRKQKSEYLELIAIVERENAELKTKVAQLGQQQRCLEEGQSERRESLAAPRGWFEEWKVSYTGERLSRAEGAPQTARSRVLSQLGALAGDRQDLERQPVDQVQTLEDKFQLKIRELQAIHEEELRALQEHYSQTLRCLQKTLHHYQGRPPAAPPAHGPPSSSRPAEGEADSMMGLKGRIQELEAQVDVLREALEHKDLAGGAASLREERQRDFESLKATCERGFAAMEETHQKKIEDLQRQHQRELEKLREEKDRLLAEETAATISAIEAMKNAHREEMERELEKSQRSQISSVNADIDALQRQYLEELQSVQRELEVLSEQYSQKCLENAHLAQALEAERQALRQCQRENQELNAHNQELNNRLAAEISRLRTLLTGDAGGEAAGSPLTQGKDAYELEVLLRVKESEIQYLKQEISSLKDELQTALRDKKYASDKYKDIYTELSIVRAKADCDVSRLQEQLKAATDALGERSPEHTPVSGGYDIMKSKSNPDFLKKDRSCVSRQLRSIRSKSVIEQVSWDN